MIILHTIGGLGNQMFQYAAGRALSLKKGAPLKLDSSGFRNYGLHQGFELQRVFNCQFDLASKSEIKSILGWQWLPICHRILSRVSFERFRYSGFVVEPHFQYWPEFKQSPPDCYLVGYWQSEKYFSDVAAIIRNDFSFRQPLSSRNAELAEYIGNVNAISMHVRRGDYASNPKTAATHGLCSIEYYQAAIRYLTERVEHPVFFIFSDDMVWVKNNLKLDFPCHYVENNKGSESYNDMRLMSLCRHNIVANSSFSWWGAWLNLSTEKIVIAPRKWFSKQIDVQDLFPDGWISL